MPQTKQSVLYFNMPLSFSSIFFFSFTTIFYFQSALLLLLLLLSWHHRFKHSCILQPVKSQSVNLHSTKLHSTRLHSSNLQTLITNLQSAISNLQSSISNLYSSIFNLQSFKNLHSNCWHFSLQSIHQTHLQSLLLKSYQASGCLQKFAVCKYVRIRSIHVVITTTQISLIKSQTCLKLGWNFLAGTRLTTGWE